MILKNVVLCPAASVSPENCLEMQVLGPYPRPPESETHFVMRSEQSYINLS